MTIITSQIAKNLREVCLGGNWTVSCLKEHLADVDWQLATAKLPLCNTIAALTYHIHYYVAAALQVFQDEPLTANDKYSFDVPPIESPVEWELFLGKIYADFEKLANFIEQLPDEHLQSIFVEPKYGNYYRNLHGIVEHTHYHLGQIVLIKKMLRSTN